MGATVQKTINLHVHALEDPEALLAAFESLSEGEALLLISSEDPIPLRYLLELKARGRYGWKYVEQGPHRWRVLIDRHAFDGQRTARFDVLPPNPGWVAWRARAVG